jgi:DNA polymerase III delta subunit
MSGSEQMITLLLGENSFEIERELSRLVAAFDGAPEKFDGAELEAWQLPDMLMGLSLFAEKRLVIIRGLSEGKQVWEALPDMLGRMSDDIHLVLIEPSIDKRTKTYKALQKVADVKEYPLWGERDRAKAERWIKEEAGRMGVTLDTAAARELLERSLAVTEKGQVMIDPWQVMHSLEKLAVLGEITVSTVQQYIDERPVDSVFSIFETALKGDPVVLHRLLSDIEPREDPFRVFGLLSGQVFQLATLALGDKPTGEVASAIGMHPFAAGKLAPHAKKLNKGQVREIVLVFAGADEAMKTSKGAPWILIEQALMKVTTAVKPN